MVNWEYSVGFDFNYFKFNDVVYDYKCYFVVYVEDNSVVYYEFKKYNIQQCVDYVFDLSFYYKYVY